MKNSFSFPRFSVPLHTCKNLLTGIELLERICFELRAKERKEKGI